MPEKRSFESVLCAIGESNFVTLVWRLALDGIDASAEIPGMYAPLSMRAAALVKWLGAGRLDALRAAILRVSPEVDRFELYPESLKVWALAFETRPMQVVRFDALAKAYVELVGPCDVARPGSKQYVAEGSLLGLAQHITCEEASKPPARGFAPVNLMLLALVYNDRAPSGDYLVLP